jgi:hypothetical protein
MTDNELTRRRRVVKGWAFLCLPDDIVHAIRKYLEGGPVPPGYEQADFDEPSPKKR